MNYGKALEALKDGKRLRAQVGTGGASSLHCRFLMSIARCDSHTPTSTQRAWSLRTPMPRVSVCLGCRRRRISFPKTGML